MKNPSLLLLCLGLWLSTCSRINPPGKKPTVLVSQKGLDSPLQHIRLPAGFHIELYAEDVPNARSIALSPAGTMYVGTRKEGSVYALQDRDGDGKMDQRHLLARDLWMPNGVAYRDGDLYVAEVNRVLKFPQIEQRLESPGEPEVLYDQYPDKSHHGWKYIAFGPDGKLYIPVGAPCNICESEDIFNTITRMNPDGTGMEIVHRGIRNTVGFTWHPQTKELWFTDNGRDWMGDDMPACELNHASQDDLHFGYPYCHQGDTPDPEFGSKRNCTEFTAPIQKITPHAAPLGLEFYRPGNFPARFADCVFIAEHGSWNREKKSGYRVTMVRLQDGKAVSYEPFAEGWLLPEDEVWGRPVDLEWLPDGSLLVSDDFANAVYRIYYTG